MLRVRTRRELYSLLVRYSLRRGIWYRIAPAGREVHAVPVPFLCVYLTAGGTFVLRPPLPFRPSSSSRRSRRRLRRRTRTNRYGSRGVGYTCLYPPAPMGPARRCLTLSRPSRCTRSGTPSVINIRRSSLTVDRTYVGRRDVARWRAVNSCLYCTCRRGRRAVAKYSKTMQSLLTDFIEHSCSLQNAE